MCQNIESWQKLQANCCWGVGFIFCEYLSNVDKNYRNIISIQTSAFSFILITLEVYIAQDLAVKKRFVSPIFDF